MALVQTHLDDLKRDRRHARSGPARFPRLARPSSRPTDDAQSRPAATTAWTRLVPAR